MLFSQSEREGREGEGRGEERKKRTEGMARDWERKGILEMNPDSVKIRVLCLPRQPVIPQLGPFWLSPGSVRIGNMKSEVPSACLNPK